MKYSFEESIKCIKLKVYKKYFNYKPHNVCGCRTVVNRELKNRFSKEDLLLFRDWKPIEEHKKSSWHKKKKSKKLRKKLNKTTKSSKVIRSLYVEKIPRKIF